MAETQRRVLIVDDEPLIQRTMQKTLLRAGFEVETASSCAEGLERFEAAHGSEAPFDLALLDLNMPGFDGSEASGAGLELVSRLIERHPALPIVVLSAYDEANKAREAINRGARGYCVKGREQRLLELINSLLASD